MQKIKDFIYYNRKDIILVSIFIFFFVSYVLLNNNGNSENIIINEDVEILENVNQKTIMIDIKGEVVKPGTYEFNNDERIIDAINKSGGLTSNANVESINLSEKLTVEMLIIIPSKEDEVISDSNSTKVVKEKKEVNDGKISINTGSISELMKLQGIGQKKAEAIIEYREKNGLFKDIKDITKVAGIGNSIFEKIKDNIKV